MGHRRTKIDAVQSELADLLHQPAVATFLLGVVAGGAFTAIANLRNIDVWLLQLTGRQAAGVVESIEIVSDRGDERMQRPTVVFTTDDGVRVVGKPSLYRRSTSLVKGATVPVRYSARNPARIVVRGFGFRYREPVYACLGAVVAIAVSILYFGL